jgi:hypothetical protein
MDWALANPDPFEKCEAYEDRDLKQTNCQTVTSFIVNLLAFTLTHARKQKTVYNRPYKFADLTRIIFFLRVEM